ncbi:putative set-like protein [Moniliophthora roreri MCA 2997]|uniref:Histone-lysine N-methyltransferase SET5 n=1 Tax=Moniliophthora roreri (strain MCA 2997) TaxID=1381753 RepID=V2XHX4_MONRO|nr:putative set-like protein [Moniliophthora roreri MCA 2997]
MTSTITPSDVDLREALKSLKSTNPTLGIPKIHALLLQTHPEWLVSEKRTRKFLQSEGLVLSTEPAVLKTPYPSSRVIRDLDVQKWSTKVEVKYFNKNKGKGLVAKEEIAEGEVIWREDPFVVAPEWEIYDLQASSAACSYCTTPFTSSISTSLVTNCPSGSSECPARFCNRLCQARSAKHHPLLCPAQNPASVPLLKWARESEWLALHALAQLTSRLILANQLDASGKLLEEDWRVYSSLAQMSLEDRAKYCFGQSEEEAKNQPGWKKAYDLYIQAFRNPASSAEQKKLAKLYKKSLRADIETELFDYHGFLRGLGRMSLNLEAHGGLYTLHSHLNHCCVPNVSVRHIDQRNALSRITVVAKRDIEPGEELLVTYVNPNNGVVARRQELQEWGFGQCMCERCVKEAKALPKDEGKSIDATGKTDETGALDMTDLEKELKAGFGVM